MSDVSSVSTSSTTYITTSNLDAEALIENAVEQRLQPAARLETRIEEINTEVAAYVDLQNLLTELDDSLEALRNSDDASISDSFDQRVAYLSAGDGSDADNLLGVTVSDGVLTGSYEVEILQIAEAEKIASASIADDEGSLNYDGSFVLAADDGVTTTVTVSADMSLNEIASAINAISDDTKISATVLQVSDGDYRLVLSATSTGADISLSDDSGTILQDLGLIDESGANVNVLQAAQPAVISVDGIEITRDSNDIDDVLDGITLYLYDDNEGVTIQLEVEPDLASVKEKLLDFVDAFNALREFVLTNQQTDADGGAAESAVLFADSNLRLISNEVLTVLANSSDASELSSIANLGLEFDENDYLIVDEDMLDEALLGDLTAVQDLLQFRVTSSSSDLQVLRNGGSSDVLDFVLDVEVDTNGNISGVSVDGDDSLFEINGSRILGVDGTAYEGLVFVFSGGVSESIDVSVSRGIFEQLHAVAYKYGDGSDGILQDVIDASETQVDRLEEDISAIEQRAEIYRERLTNYYARLEVQIATAESLKEQLTILFEQDD